MIILKVLAWLFRVVNIENQKIDKFLGEKNIDKFAHEYFLFFKHSL